MTATLPVPTRYLALIGVTLLLAALFFVVRPLLLTEDSETAATPATPTAPATGSNTPATPSTPSTPKVELVKGLPPAVWTGLQRHEVLVVQVYSGTATPDRSMVGVSRRAAKATGAGFVAMNVLDEARARQVSSLVGTVDTPAVVVVRRPGKVTTLIEGPVDGAIVEQAAHNAGARR